MNSSEKINNIINQVAELDNNSKIQVIEKILSMIKRKEKNKKVSVRLTDLKGIGAEIWNNISIDNYLSNERKWE